MNGLYFFSGTGNSLSVADYIEKRTKIPKTEITFSALSVPVEVAFVVFPVYCQNIPLPVKRFLSILQAEKVVIIATYGGISYGNVLCEASEIIRCKAVAATAISMKHSLLNNTEMCGFHSLDKLIDGIYPENISLIKHHKNIFADFFPSFRSRIGIRMRKNEKCSGCNHCNEICPVNGIQAGIFNSKCIRCLKCVRECPKQALSFELSPILKLYLNKKVSQRLNSATLFF